MQTYQQSTGIWQDATGETLGVGYSGQPPHTNVASDEGLEGLGPIPAGSWTMTGVELETPLHGPYVIVLAPHPDTRARILAMPRDPDSFRIHGERFKPPAGFASDGCIILSRSEREAIWNSGDHELQVVS